MIGRTLATAGALGPWATKLARADELDLMALAPPQAGGLHTAPSAGALYPLELHLVAARVEGLRAGVYRYLPKLHKLQPAIPGTVLPELERAAFGQQPVADAAAVFVMAAVEQRTGTKYGGRANRYVVFEAGAASQNLALQATAQDLGTVVIGAFDDAAVARTLGFADGERPLALIPAGRPG